MPTAPRRHQPPRHAREARPSSAARGYGRSWRRIRSAYLAAHPLCVGCDRALATEVDHVIAKVKGGTDDWSNLVAYCKSCHSRKTTAVDGGGFQKKGAS